MKSKVKAKKAAPKRPARKVAAPVKHTRRGRSSTSRISSKHQVTIPVEVLRSSGFSIGDDLIVKVSSDGMKIELEKVRDSDSHPFAKLIGLGTGLYEGWNLEKEREESWPE